MLKIKNFILARKYKTSLIHQVINAHLSNSHKSTSTQKTRAQVKGSGLKPWKQKGTGRARVGNKRNPIWRGGGVTFASSGKITSQKINKKMYKKCMLFIFSKLFEQGRLNFINDTILSNNIKSKILFKSILNSLSSRCLIITSFLDINLNNICKNMYDITVIQSYKLNPVIILKYNKIFITLEAFMHVKKIHNNEL